jgi:hypothetical protein
MNHMQKNFFNVSQILLVPETPIFGIIFKLLNPENQNIKDSKHIFQTFSNRTSVCKN